MELDIFLKRFVFPSSILEWAGGKEGVYQYEDLNVKISKINFFFWEAPIVQVAFMKYLKQKYSCCTPHLQQIFNSSKTSEYQILVTKRPSCGTMKDLFDNLEDDAAKEALVFQVLYTMAVLEKNEEKLVHSALTLDNIHVFPSSEGYVLYKLAYRNYYVYQPGMSVQIAGWEHAAMPGTLENETVLRHDIPTYEVFRASLLEAGIALSRSATTFAEAAESFGKRFGRKKSRNFLDSYYDTEIFSDVSVELSRGLRRCTQIAVPLRKDDFRRQLAAYIHMCAIKRVLNYDGMLDDASAAFIYDWERLGDLKGVLPILEGFEAFMGKIDFAEDIRDEFLFDWLVYVVVYADKRNVYDFKQLHCEIQKLIPKFDMEFKIFKSLVVEMTIQYNWASLFQ